MAMPVVGWIFIGLSILSNLIRAFGKPEIADALDPAHNAVGTLVTVALPAVGGAMLHLSDKPGKAS